MSRDELEAAPGNAVVYSERAWSVARKEISGRRDGHWFPDPGSSMRHILTAEEMVLWVDDWVLMVPAQTRGEVR